MNIPSPVISTVPSLQWPVMLAASTVTHASHVKVPPSLEGRPYTNAPPLVLEMSSLAPCSHLIVGVVTRFMTTPTSHRRESVSPEKSSPRQLLCPDPALERTVVLTSGRGRPGRGRSYLMWWLPTKPLTATHSGQRWRCFQIHCFPVQRLWRWSGQCPQYMYSLYTSSHPGCGGG